MKWEDQSKVPGTEEAANMKVVIALSYQWLERLLLYKFTSLSHYKSSYIIPSEAFIYAQAQKIIQCQKVSKQWTTFFHFFIHCPGSIMKWGSHRGRHHKALLCHGLPVWPWPWCLGLPVLDCFNMKIWGWPQNSQRFLSAPNFYSPGTHRSQPQQVLIYSFPHSIWVETPLTPKVWTNSSPLVYYSDILLDLYRNIKRLLSESRLYKQLLDNWP